MARMNAVQSERPPLRQRLRFWILVASVSLPVFVATWRLFDISTRFFERWDKQVLDRTLAAADEAARIKDPLRQQIEALRIELTGTPAETRKQQAEAELAELESRLKPMTEQSLRRFDDAMAKRWRILYLRIAALLVLIILSIVSGFGLTIGLNRSILIWRASRKASHGEID